MQRQNKRWLISMMKTSGSKRKYVANGTMADSETLADRIREQLVDLPDVAEKEMMGGIVFMYY